jgi:hypothetical protein
MPTLCTSSIDCLHARLLPRRRGPYRVEDVGALLLVDRLEWHPVGAGTALVVDLPDYFAEVLED